jgi:hypothetical protein
MKNMTKAFLFLFFLLFDFLTVIAQARNEYALLKGNIGSLPVTMHLYKNEHYYSGYYYQEKLQRPIEVLGIDSTRTGRLTLTANYKGKKEIFTLDRADKKFSGFMAGQFSY